MADAPSLIYLTQDAESEKMLTELTGSSGRKVQIRRTNPETGKPAVLDTVDSETFSVEWLAQEWGGGDYSIQEVKPNGQFSRGFTLSVDKMRVGRREQEAEKKIVSGGSSHLPEFQHLTKLLEKSIEARGGGGGDLAAILRMQSDQNQFIMRMQSESNAQTMQLMATMMTALAGRPQPDYIRLFEVGMPLLQTVMGTMRGNGQSLEALLKQHEKIKDVFGSREPEPSSPFEKFMGMLSDVAGAVIAAKTGGELPGGETKALEEGAQSEQMQAMEQINSIREKYAKHLPKLLLLSNVKSPTRVGEMIVDLMEPEEMPIVQQMVASEQWKELLFANDPRIDKKSAWFNSLREDIATRLSETLADSTTDDDAPTDPPNITPPPAALDGSLDDRTQESDQ